MTDTERLAAIAERHVHDSDDTGTWCLGCDEDWPCDTRIVLDELEAQAKGHAACEANMDAALDAARAETPGLDVERLARALCRAQEAGQALDKVAPITADHWRGVAARTLAAIAPDTEETPDV